MIDFDELKLKARREGCKRLRTYQAAKRDRNHFKVAPFVLHTFSEGAEFIIDLLRVEYAKRDIPSTAPSTDT